ncbi:MAG: hypothetical protein EB084_26310, partial [Proteobacteria bacterium]|nr:hypothetical protein [Pseudomonadota bacterium]
MAHECPSYLIIVRTLVEHDSRVAARGSAEVGHARHEGVKDLASLQAHFLRIPVHLVPNRAPLGA